MSAIAEAKRIYSMIYEQPKAHREIGRLRDEHATPTAKAIGNALDEVCRRTVSTEEKAWIKRIEFLREELNDSSDETVVTDYGAGATNLGLSESEMSQGRAARKTVGQICRDSKSPQEALLLFKLVRNLKPERCLELGTCLGISTAYQAAALELNGAGRVVTLEGAASLASLARENFGRLNLRSIAVREGRFRDTLAGVLRELSRVDFAFVDGHHDEHATLAYFNQIVPYCSPNAVVVFDDISWSTGMKRAWKVIARDERVGTSVDLSGTGICVVKSSGRKRSFKFTLR